jgi:hypothetical protein
MREEIIEPSGPAGCGRPHDPTPPEVLGASALVKLLVADNRQIADRGGFVAIELSTTGWPAGLFGRRDTMVPVLGRHREDVHPHQRLRRASQSVTTHSSGGEGFPRATPPCREWL